MLVLWFSGKIAWARQLFRRIQEPMEVFQQHPVILQGIEAKKIIKNYNKLAKVLLEFEVLYHRGWLRQVRSVDFFYKLPKLTQKVPFSTVRWLVTHECILIKKLGAWG